MSTLNFDSNATLEPLGGTVVSTTSYLESMAGAGFEDMPSTAMAVSYLGIVQPDSGMIDENNSPGTWRNSSTAENYGNIITVIPLAFRTIWNEREADPPFRTVGRYPVGGIKVETRLPSKGKRGYPKMINPDTGNEIQELFIYALLLVSDIEAGVTYFNPTIGSMRTAKTWNSALKSQRLPNGKQAPIFAYKWNLCAELVQNPQQPSKQMARFTKVTRDSIVDEDTFLNYIQPQISIVRQNVIELTSTLDSLSE